ncbi:Wadjet anti-phage system protein JetD domain-containing protein [Saccharomonospora sp. NPDC046836]|uniref:Wadjet anti-phage system protein JetD domain-containing protein n=1 Tax=Saccharomonospora sp. NPDC046836 TaxID=3156921 RepID=UPI0033D35B33
MAPTGWTVPGDVIGKLRRRWDRGEFLSQLVRGTRWEPVAIGLRGPTAQDTSVHLDHARAWVEEWQRARHLRVEMRTVGGRVVGTNEIPGRVWIDSYEQLWAVLGVQSEVRTCMALLDATRRRAPTIADWMSAKPMEVLRHKGEWARLVDTVLWIDAYARPDMYLRQIDVPGVDTKFIERHRAILAVLLDCLLAEHRVDRTRPPSDFAGRYLFRKKPAYVRFRHLSEAPGFSELAVRVSELAAMPPAVRTVFVVENEITYLAFPPVDNAIVIFGEGYAASRLEPLHWLARKNLVYWGDIDTHGFAILSRVRRTFEGARSMLMDRATLLAHDGQWVDEPNPTTDHLESLLPDEASLYNDLVEGVLGSSVRLEQERISYAAIQQATRQHH